MQQDALKYQTTVPQGQTPLDALSALLDQDMQKVNALIVENMQSNVPLIPKLAQYLIAAGGKRIRPLLTLASTAMFNGPMDKAYHLAAAVEFIHTATLLHDDVVDESFERRGQQTANLVFGNQASVLVGDYLFSKSFQMMVESGSLDILRVLSDAAAIIAQGEVLQLSTTNDITTTLPAYLEVIESKTAALFAASCEVGAILSGRAAKEQKHMRVYGMKLGTAFQIIDDALDYSANQNTLGKEVGDDFKEGKMTAPVILAIEKATTEEQEFWKRTLAHKKQTENDLQDALSLINKYNCIEQTLELAQQYISDAKTQLADVERNQYSTLLSDVADYTLTRNF